MANYNISDIEGIGPKYAEKLVGINIRTVNSLLKEGCTKVGRRTLAAQSDIEESNILKWVNMADLYRVNGVGSEYSELLEKAGVDTVKELRTRNAENLHNKMKEINSAGRPLVRQLPGLSTVKAWIEDAKQLEPMVTY